MRNKEINVQQVFFALVRAGLWEQGVRLQPFERIDFSSVYKLAEEQSVVGLVAAGLDHVQDMKVQKKDVIQFIGDAFHLEQRNISMNSFIRALVDRMRGAGISCVLIKGQGIAQCYERPLWRCAGDVDLLLDTGNYEKAKAFLTPLAARESITGIENVKEYCMTIDSWIVELHGTLRCRLTGRMERALDGIQERICKGEVRGWQIEGQTIPLPSGDSDVFVIFTHLVKHFFKGGIGLRQICDWCRLMWTFRDSIDKEFLESGLRRMGLMTEWKAFAAYVVEYLGMPVDAMPFYEDKVNWRRRARHIYKDILREGNFGHNRDYSYYGKYPFFISKTISLWGHFRDAVRHSILFPVDSWRVFFKVFSRGVNAVLQRKV